MSSTLQAIIAPGYAAVGNEQLPRVVPLPVDVVVFDRTSHEKLSAP